MQSNKAASIGFIFGYMLFFYLTLGVAMKIPYFTIGNSWQILGEYKNMMEMLLLIYPLIALIFGIALASISLLSYSAMGSDILTSFKFFSIGCFWIIIANIAVLSTALQLFIDKGVGQEWIQTVGDLEFKVIFWLLLPSIGYVGGVIFSIVFQGLIEAQRK